MQTRVLHASVSFVSHDLAKPLVLSSGRIDGVTEATFRVRVRAGEMEAEGVGSIYLSDFWAWPDPSVAHEARDSVLRSLCRRIAVGLPELTAGEAAHPLEHGLRLHDWVVHEDLGAPQQIPVLARAMCLSPLDAAIHDATGIAMSRSAFDFYDDGDPIPSADQLFSDGACKAVRRLLRREPQWGSPAWVIVGKDDLLEHDVRPWIVQRQYKCLKLKLTGRDNTADVARTVEVFHKAREWGVKQPWISVDSNEANPHAESVLDYLLRLRSADAEALTALRYLEQPTHRDIIRHRFDWRAVTSVKPVLLDEGLSDLNLLSEAQDQGWSGLALKTCKGHSFALVAGAWAHQRRMLLSLQDLTNPGYSAIHSALFAAFVPTINGIELNSPQFTPAANGAWLPRLAGLFDVRDGTHRLPEGPAPVGLGSHL